MSRTRTTNEWQAESKPVLITGGGGFIGSHLVRLLTKEGHNVRVLELADAATQHLPQRRVQILHGDIRQLDHVRRAAEGCRIVLHLAANPNLWARDLHEFEEVNFHGTENVLKAAQDAGVERFVHVSTESILTSQCKRGAIDGTAPLHLGEMLGPYCRSKAEAELAAKAAADGGFPVVIASPTVPVGPGDRKRGPMSRLICDFARGRIKAFLDGQVNLIDVRDAAAGIWAAAQFGRIGQRYLLAGDNWTFAELFYAFSALTNQPMPRWRVPYSVALSFAWLEELYCRFLSRRTPCASVTGVRLTRRSFRFDGSASAEELGLRARPTFESLRAAIIWFQQLRILDTMPIPANASLAAQGQAGS